MKIFLAIAIVVFAVTTAGAAELVWCQSARQKCQSARLGTIGDPGVSPVRVGIPGPGVGVMRLQ